MPKRTLILIVLTGALLVGEDKPAAPAIDPELTIAHLTKVIEAQAVHILSLQAQLDDVQKGGALGREVGANIAKMQVACAAKDSTLVVNPQTGLYAPDAKGMPQCKPNPPKPAAAKEAPKK